MIHIQIFNQVKMLRKINLQPYSFSQKNYESVCLDGHLSLHKDYRKISFMYFANIFSSNKEVLFLSLALSDILLNEPLR